MAVAAISKSHLNFTEKKYGNFILERLRVQRDLGKFCDITLYVEGKQFRAHRSVLASCSPYFDKLLKTNRTVKEHLTITCNSTAVFQCLLNYMYTGSVDIDKDNIEELLRLASIFLLSKLKNHCLEYLQDNIDTTNCLLAKDLADKYNIPSLTKYATTFIKDNIDTVMIENEILEAPISALEAFLTEEAWTVPQDLLLSLVTRWVRFNVRERERHTRTLLTFVDWNRMESAAISEHVDKDPLYPASELSLFAVLQALLANNLLFNKYQVVFDALRDKFSQVSYLGEEAGRATTSCESDVKMEAMSPAPSPDECSPAEIVQEESPPNSPNITDGDDMYIDTEESSIDETPSKRPKQSSPDENEKTAEETNEDDSVNIKNDPDVDLLEAEENEENDLEESSLEKDGDADFAERRWTRAAKSSSSDKNKPKQFSTPQVQTESKSPLGTGRRGRAPGSGRRLQRQQLEHEVEEDPPEIERPVIIPQEGKDQFTCRECKFTSTFIKDHYRHLKEHFPGPPFKCENCDYSCDKIVNFLAHREKTCDDKPHHCTVCDYKCRSRPYLLVHMRSHTGELKYKCETCGRAYAMRSTLEQHRTSHSKEQPYLCDACGFATKYIAHLMAHKRIHTGDVFKCTFPDCKYSTPKKSQLNCHLRTHEGVRPHTCHICGRGFLEKSHLVRHERIHLDDKPFKCDHCDYASSRRDKLKEHYLRHHGESAPARGTYRSRPVRFDEHGSDSKGSMGCDDYNLDNASSAHSSSHGGGPGGDATEVMMVSQQEMTPRFVTFSAGLAHPEHPHAHLHVDYQHHDESQSSHSTIMPSNGDVLDKNQDGLASVVLHPSQISQQILVATTTPTRNHSASMSAMMLDSRYHHNTVMPSYSAGSTVQLAPQAVVITTTQLPVQPQGSSEFPCMSLY